MAALLALVLAPPAIAGPYRVRVAQGIALERTGPVCTADGGKVTVARSRAVRGLARVLYSYPAGAPNDRRGYFDCRVEFRGGHIRWAAFCRAMVHEYLHLAAWRARPGDEYVGRMSDGSPFLDPLHSRRRSSIMYVRPERTYPPCRRPPPKSPLALRD